MTAVPKAAPAAPRAAGRPREFDTAQALDRALEVFWRKGYEGAAMAELTAAMGISAPSLYAAFGNKESLFRQVADRYAEGREAFIGHALQAPTARGAFERLLRGTVDLLTDSRTPAGCLFVHGALACGDEADPVRVELGKRREGVENAVRARFEQAKAMGDFPAGADPEGLARYVTTVTQGMAVQAAGGADRKSLMQVAEAALRAWPT